MSTWKQRLAQLGAALRRLPLLEQHRPAHHQPQPLPRPPQAPPLYLLDRLYRAQHLGQLLQVLQVAAHLPQEVRETVQSLAMEHLQRLHSQSASPRNSASRKKTVPSTSKRRRPR